jgi:hypothetical protein
MDSFPLIPGNLETLLTNTSDQSNTTGLMLGLVATIVFWVLIILTFRSWLDLY